MKERERLGREVVIKTYRKHGNGAKGGGRKGQTGKKGAIYKICEDGTRAELASDEGTSFTDLSRKLRDTGFIPSDIAINRSGTTSF